MYAEPTTPSASDSVVFCRGGIIISGNGWDTLKWVGLVVSVTVTVTVEVPVTLVVPVIAPVAGSMLRPAGKPVAAHV